MLKLYRLTETTKEYWETWEESEDSHVVHWGTLGTKGKTKNVPVREDEEIPANVQRKIAELRSEGFKEIDPEDHFTLMIEYAIEGMGTKKDLKKRHRLEDLMNETLGWVGLGACDGGSIGMDTMEVCNLVVDYDIARRVVEAALVDTEFADYKRIYREE